MDELYCNFKKSLEQKYNAICLDIDGTLTAKDSKKIDERAIKMIIELLRKNTRILLTIYNQKECFLLFISNKDDSKLENQIEKLIEMEQ